MPRLARDEQAALTLAIAGTILLAHRLILRALAHGLRVVDEARAEVE